MELNEIEVAIGTDFDYCIELREYGRFLITKQGKHAAQNMINDAQRVPTMNLLLILVPLKPIYLQNKSKLVSMNWEVV